jgi:uncharacterized protein (DUF427 family)
VTRPPEPCPRRIRGVLAGETVVDTLRALYVWDHDSYPAYCFPADDVRVEGRGTEHGVRVEWDALDAWYEEDEQVFVHPRDPYVRVDALRSHRHVRVAHEGVLLAETRTPVLVFETGLRTRYYVDRFDVVWSALTPSATVTSCPYKGTTSGYWAVGGQDVAWSYDFPTAPLLPVAGLVAFYDEDLDVTVDGVPVA